MPRSSMTRASWPMEARCLYLCVVLTGRSDDAAGNGFGDGDGDGEDDASARTTTTFGCGRVEDRDDRPRTRRRGWAGERSRRSGRGGGRRKGRATARGRRRTRARARDGAGCGRGRARDAPIGRVRSIGAADGRERVEVERLRDLDVEGGFGLGCHRDHGDGRAKGCGEPRAELWRPPRARHPKADGRRGAFFLEGNGARAPFPGAPTSK